jgi:hypothetical protein
MMFAYGCLGATLCIGWLTGWVAVPVSEVTFGRLLTAHALVLGLTLMYPRLADWQAVLVVNRRRVIFARVALGAALTLIPLAGAGLLDTASHVQASRQSVVAFAAALFTSLYIALHWGLRPENLFSRRILRRLNPLVHALANRRRRERSGKGR